MNFILPYEEIITVYYELDWQIGHYFRLSE